ncbi:MAG TPA: helix-turn-helix domain-containing protein [Opitutaceae bacterium]|nr:helix-turn-helix domain-containing protein [Opitutaceae bacterium]
MSPKRSQPVAKASKPSKSSSKKIKMSAEDRKDAILKQALTLFARDGYHGVTTRQLAKAAGVSEALLFKYFPTKQALRDRLYRHCMRNFTLDDEKISQLEPSTTSLVRLIYFCTRVPVLHAIARQSTMSRLINQSLLGDGVFAQLILQGQSLINMEAKAVACLKAGIACGEIEKAGPALADRFWFARNAVHMTAMHHMPEKPIRRYTGTPREVVVSLTCFALRGMGLSDAALSRYASAKRLAEIEQNESETLLLPHLRSS